MIVVEDVEDFFRVLTDGRRSFIARLFPELVGFFREVGGYSDGQELESYDALVGIAQAVSAHRLGLFVDWNEASLLRHACWELVEINIGLPNAYWSSPDRYRVFEWDGADVGEGLVAFDWWLSQENVEFQQSVPNRLLNVDTGSDFYLALLIPEDKAPEIIESLAGLGLKGSLAQHD